MGDYKRILLKLSGEALAGEQGFGFDEANVLTVGKQIKELVKKLERRDARISELELKVKQYKKRFKC